MESKVFFKRNDLFKQKHFSNLGIIRVVGVEFTGYDFNGFKEQKIEFVLRNGDRRNRYVIFTGEFVSRYVGISS
jgi:hypothetical protein